MYAGAEDPWGFRSRWYEQRKRDVTLAALTRPRYRRAFEPGCSIGVLTAALADALRRGASPPTSTTGRVAPPGEALRQHGPRAGRAPGGAATQWPDGMFDLVVLSEVGYYLEPAALDRLLDRAVELAAAARHAARLPLAAPGRRLPGHRRRGARAAARPAGAGRCGPARGGGLPARPADPRPGAVAGPRARACCRDADVQVGRGRGAGPGRGGAAAGCPAALDVAAAPRCRGSVSRSTCSWSPTAARTAPPTVAPGRGGRPCSRCLAGAVGPARAAGLRHLLGGTGPRCRGTGSGWRPPTPTRGCPANWLVRAARARRRRCRPGGGNGGGRRLVGAPAARRGARGGPATTGGTGTGTCTAPTSVPAPTPTWRSAASCAGPRRGRGARGRAGPPTGAAHRRHPGRHQRPARGRGPAAASPTTWPAWPDSAQTSRQPRLRVDEGGVDVELEVQVAAGGVARRSRPCRSPDPAATWSPTGRRCASGGCRWSSAGRRRRCRGTPRCASRRRCSSRPGRRCPRGPRGSGVPQGAPRSVPVCSL